MGGSQRGVTPTSGLLLGQGSNQTPSIPGVSWLQAQAVARFQPPGHNPWVSKGWMGLDFEDSHTKKFIYLESTTHWVLAD